MKMNCCGGRRPSSSKTRDIANLCKKKIVNLGSPIETVQFDDMVCISLTPFPLKLHKGCMIKRLARESVFKKWVKFNFFLCSTSIPLLLFIREGDTPPLLPPRCSPHPTPSPLTQGSSVSLSLKPTEER